MGIPRTLSARISTNAPARFGVAVVATVLALLVARVLSPFVGGAVPYVMALAAVAYSTRYCGAGPSFASAAVSLLAIDFWFIAPTHSLRIMHPADRSNSKSLPMESGPVHASSCGCLSPRLGIRWRG